MNRRQAFKEETRELILASAKKLFREMDIEKCTMRAIAKEAGVSAASVVVHFNNKRSLMEAALAEDIDATTVQAITTMPDGGELAERLTHIWRTMYRFYAANRDLYRVLIRSTIFEPAQETPFLSAQTDTFFRFLNTMIEEEKADGRLDQGVDSDTMAAALFAQYFGVLILFYRDPSMTAEMAAELVLATTRQTLAGLTQHPEA